MSARDEEPGTTAASSGPLWAVVPAAGEGARMRRGGPFTDRPKQYLPLAGRTLIERTLDTLLALPGLAGVVVALAPGDRHWETLEVARDRRVHRASGAISRAASVAAALAHLATLAPPDSRVLVHDAARPLVTLADIQRLIEAVASADAVGGLLAVPVQDTLKRAAGRDGEAGEGEGRDARIVATVSRERLWQAQTPQLFRLGALSDALSAALDATLDVTLNTDPDVSSVTAPSAAAAAITDEASAMERSGHAPLLIEALDPNPKITRPSDLDIAEALLGRRAEGTCA